MIWRGTAPAKVNLTLHITGQRADGYHLLDSLVVFADIADRVTLTPAHQMSLTVTGPFARGVPTDARNLMWRVAAGYSDQPLAMTLEKHLPHPAGIGGGSSDAAAVLRGIAALSGRPLPRDTQTVGADVPVCLTPIPQIMRGIGDACTPAPGLPPMAIVLVNPGVPVPTGAVFASLARKDNTPQDAPPQGPYATWIAWLRRQRNDLEAPARALAPEVAQALCALTQAGADLSRMSGSGGTCFGLFPTYAAADRAAKAIAHPGWWVKAAKVLP